MTHGIRKISSAIGTVLLAASAMPAAAEDWQIELTPYLWAANVDGDVAVREQVVSIKADFGDIVKAVDMGAALLFRAERNNWVVFTQIDYLSLDSDNLDDAPERGRLEQDMLMASAAFGREFATSDGRRSLDVLVGMRHLSMDNTLTFETLGRFEGSRDLNDPILMLRPSFQFAERWRFNPTFAYGAGGDSEKVWEMQPTVEFKTGDKTALRFGYRKLYYEAEGSRTAFDGGFQGLFVGYGGTFGGSN